MLRLLTFATLCALFVTTFSTSSALAQSSNGPLIFDVRRSLPLEPNEPVYKDFYINAGPEAGFKKGVYISVVRPLPIHDPIQNKQQATLNVPVGHLQVIHVERGITVARLQDELGDEERPTLEFEGVMVGDKIDLASMTTTAPKRPAPPKKDGGGLFGAIIVGPKPASEQPPVQIQLQTTESASQAPAPLAPATSNAPTASAPTAAPTNSTSTSPSVAPSSLPAAAPSVAPSAAPATTASSAATSAAS